MKYPITPEYLETAPEPLVKLFADLEAEILRDICRRFRLSGEATESAIAQIKLLQERGGDDLKDIEKAIKKALQMSDEELEEVFERAVERNRQYYEDLIGKADIVNADYKGVDSAVDAIKRQTREEFVNLTQSLGFAVRTGAEVEFLPIAKTYQKILDDAAAQVISGAFDYNTAIKNAVKRLTDSGLQMIDYASGWHNRADVAARKAVMTGVSQLSAQYAEQSAEILETDLREVTAHQGARDKGIGWQNHKAWQGKVYSVSGNHPKYPSIYAVCGWGEVDGLEGANCRHHHFPFLDGVSERTYTDEQLANIDPPPFEYQGKTYTAYEATQKQRQIETAMRKCKREMVGYEAAGMTEDYQNSAVKLRRLSAEYKNFSKAAGLREQPERSRVLGYDARQVSKSKIAVTNYNRIESARADIKAGKYPLVINDEKQQRHNVATATPGRSVVTLTTEEQNKYVKLLAGSGKLRLNKNRVWDKKETVEADKEIGYTVNDDGIKIQTKRFKIHYSKTGVHIVPYSGG